MVTLLPKNRKRKKEIMAGFPREARSILADQKKKRRAAPLIAQKKLPSCKAREGNFCWVCFLKIGREKSFEAAADLQEGRSFLFFDGI